MNYLNASSDVTISGFALALFAPMRTSCFSCFGKFRLAFIVACVVPLLADCSADFKQRSNAGMALMLREPGSGAAPIRGEGGALLDDAVSASPEIAEGVKENGTPDAIDVNNVFMHTRVLLFYANPPHILWYTGFPGLYSLHFDQVSSSQEVPRSVRRLGFGEGPMPPPWPTIPADQAAIYGAPKVPAPPDTTDPAYFAPAYAGISDAVRKQTVEVRKGESFDRAAKAFARLNPSSRLPGFNWRLVVLRSPDNLGAGALDGTIFLSDGLVSRLSNDELVAVIAHLLGHAAYRHDRDFWTEASPAKRVGVVAAEIVGGTVLAGVGLLACGGNPDACEGGLKIAGAGLQITGSGLVNATKVASGPSEIPPPDQESVHSDYSRDQEVEANFIAVKYLHDVGIPPDTLFDALAKLAKEPSPFSQVHHADVSAADLGKMLDVGMIPTK